MIIIISVLPLLDLRYSLKLPNTAFFDCLEIVFASYPHAPYENDLLEYLINYYELHNVRIDYEDLYDNVCNLIHVIDGHIEENFTLIGINDREKIYTFKFDRFLYPDGVIFTDIGIL